MMTTEPETAPSSPAPQDPQQMLAETREAKDRGDLKAHADLLAKVTARYQADYPEGTGTDGTPASPAYEPPVPLTEAQAAIAQDFAADVRGLDVPVPIEEKGAVLDFAISGAVHDNVDLSDESACFQVLRTRHGAATEGIVDDCRKAVQALGPNVADMLNSTGAGNSPSVIEALAMWQRGHFRLSPEQARQRLASEKDPTLRRLLAMLAARS